MVWKAFLRWIADMVSTFSIITGCLWVIYSSLFTYWFSGGNAALDEVLPNTMMQYRFVLFIFPNFIRKDTEDISTLSFPSKV